MLRPLFPSGPVRVKIAKPKGTGRSPTPAVRPGEKNQNLKKTPLLAATFAGRLSGGNKNGSVGSVPRLAWTLKLTMPSSRGKGSKRCIGSPNRSGKVAIGLPCWISLLSPNSSNSYEGRCRNPACRGCCRVCHCDPRARSGVRRPWPRERRRPRGEWCRTAGRRDRPRYGSVAYPRNPSGFGYTAGSMAKTNARLSHPVVDLSCTDG